MIISTNKQQIIMQQDPQFIKLVNKSFILQKAENLEIPLVKKPIQPSHEAVSKLFITSLLHIFTYGLDTVKTRSQSINPHEDVSQFKQNVASKQPLYQGFFKGYIMVLLTNTFHMTIGKQYGYIAASLLESIPKTFVEISKINSQMGHKSTDFRLIKIAYRNCLPYAMLRDIIIRSGIIEGMKIYNHMHRHDPQYVKNHNQTSGLMGICMIATFLSNPFDVLVTKLASQRYIKYQNPIHALKMVVKEEGFQKLFFSGSVPRIGIRVIEALAMKYGYQHMAELARDSF